MIYSLSAVSALTCTARPSTKLGKYIVQYMFYRDRKCIHFMQYATVVRVLCVWHKLATNRLQIRRSSRDCHFNTLRSNYAACAGGKQRVARLKVVAYVEGARGCEGACPSPFVRLTFCIIKSVAACRQLRTEVDSSRVAVDCCQRLKLPQRGHRMQCILSSSSC